MSRQKKVMNYVEVLRNTYTCICLSAQQLATNYKQALRLGRWGHKHD